MNSSWRHVLYLLSLQLVACISKTIYASFLYFNCVDFLLTKSNSFNPLNLWFWTFHIKLQLLWKVTRFGCLWRCLMNSHSFFVWVSWKDQIPASPWLLDSDERAFWFEGVQIDQNFHLTKSLQVIHQLLSLYRLKSEVILAKQNWLVFICYFF